MTYKEEQRDIFTINNECYFAHCISADFALGAGIAVEFDRRFDCKRKLNELYKRSDPELVGTALMTGKVFNLVTKEKYWHKPTLDTMKKALLSLKRQLIYAEKSKIVMPKIGCGLDRLKWADVSTLIKEVFENTNVEILVCYQ